MSREQQQKRGKKKEKKKRTKISFSYHRQYWKEDMDRFLHIYREAGDYNISRAAKKAGIKGGRLLIVKWREEFEWFDKEMDIIEDEIFDSIESFMAKKAKMNITAARAMLFGHKKGRQRGYGTRSEVTGKDGQPLTWKAFMEKAVEENKG